MKLVQGEISATSYKKLVTRLRPLNKKKLWEILDHYIFHVITDADAAELLRLLDENALEDEQLESVAASAMDDDLFYSIDPQLRFRPYAIATIPTDESLDQHKNELELMYDANCFDSYMHPEIKREVASKLIEFATQTGFPVQDHWREHAGEAK